MDLALTPPARSSSAGDEATSATDAVAEFAALVTTDPDLARRRAIAAARTATSTERVELLATAGEASIRLGAVADALSLFSSAAELAARTGHPSAGELLVRRAAMEAATGDGSAALGTLTDAERLLGSQAWRAWHQRGVLLHWSGRSLEAVDMLSRSFTSADEAGDGLTAAKALSNLAVVRAHLGDFETALAEGELAEQHCRALGDATLAAQTLHNRGWICARAGALAEGWRLMNDAAREVAWAAPPVVLADRAELAHRAGLLAEAAELAESAWQAQIAAGDRHGAATTSLLRSRIALDLGDPGAALELLDEVDELLESQGRPELLGAAGAVRLAAHLDACDQASSSDVESRLQRAQDAVRRHLDAVRHNAWRSERIDGLIAAGEIALRTGDSPGAAVLFDHVADDRDPRSPATVEHHVAAALARRARSGELDTDRLEAAWDELERRRRLPAPHELRGDWGAATRLVTRVALPPLLDRGDGDAALVWLERLRSLPAPGGGHELADAADRLRSLWASRLAERSMGDATGEGDDRSATFDQETEAALEAELVAAARSLAASSPAPEPPQLDDIAPELDETEIVWIVALSSGAWTIRCSSRGARVTPLDRHDLRSAAHRLASAMRTGSDTWRHAATELDGVLTAGIERSAGELPEKVVLVPVGSAVEDLPFAAVPSLAARRIRVCWSAGHWRSTNIWPQRSDVTIASTGVEGSSREVELLSTIWPRTTALVGPEVTAERVLAALATDDLVHVGAHGRLRRDNPMLSTLECADGPLYGYELARAGRVAPTILLWSCALGGARMPGDVGVAGWPALLAQLGCNAVIAAPGALPADPAPELAAEVHRGLAAGDPADLVLARLREVAVGELASRAAAMVAVHGAG